MPSVIALVGRPNVGKSTLFNCLTRSRDALVADQPGLTRDRKYGTGNIGGFSYIVVDTGGLSGDAQGIDGLMAGQVWQAVEEADHLLFLVDARTGPVAGDEEIAKRLRQSGKPVSVVVNKIDGVNTDLALAEFYSLGFGEPIPIAAAHGKGVTSLVELLFSASEPVAEDSVVEGQTQSIKIAIVGKPNVGKSTLVNRLLGEDRVLVFDMPGTTRDSIYIPYERDGQNYTLIDTAGVRRRGKVTDKLEKFSVIKTLQAIEHAHVVVMVIDAREGVTDQDAHLLGFVLQAGKALVLAVNKWDGLSDAQKKSVKNEIERKLPFVDFATLYFISALHGSGVGKLYQPIQLAYRDAMRDLSTPELTRMLETAVATHQPPLVRGRRIKLRYAHQGGRNPPLIIIHGNQTEHLPGTYKRYLINYFRDNLRLEGTPLRVEFKTADNPFKGKVNPLTARQIASKRRLRKHVQKKRK